MNKTGVLENLPLVARCLPYGDEDLFWIMISLVRFGKEDVAVIRDLGTFLAPVIAAIEPAPTPYGLTVLMLDYRLTCLKRFTGKRKRSNIDTTKVSSRSKANELLLFKDYSLATNNAAQKPATEEGVGLADVLSPSAVAGPISEASVSLNNDGATTASGEDTETTTPLSATPSMPISSGVSSEIPSLAADISTTEESVGGSSSRSLRSSSRTLQFETQAAIRAAALGIRPSSRLIPATTYSSAHSSAITNISKGPISRSRRRQAQHATPSLVKDKDRKPSQEDCSDATRNDEDIPSDAENIVQTTVISENAQDGPEKDVHSAKKSSQSKAVLSDNGSSNVLANISRTPFIHEPNSSIQHSPLPVPTSETISEASESPSQSLSYHAPSPSLLHSPPCASSVQHESYAMTTAHELDSFSAVSSAASSSILPTQLQRKRFTTLSWREMGVDSKGLRQYVGLRKVSSSAWPTEAGVDLDGTG